MNNPIIEEFEELKPWQIRLIVRLFAEFYNAQEISQVFPEIYGIEISADLLQIMHPEYIGGKMLPTEVVDQYWQIKGAQIKLIPLPVVSKVNRLMILDRLRFIFESRKDYERLLRVMELSENENNALYQDLLKGMDKFSGQSNLPIRGPFTA